MEHNVEQYNSVSYNSVAIIV